MVRGVGTNFKSFDEHLRTITKMWELIYLASFIERFPLIIMIWPRIIIIIKVNFIFHKLIDCSHRCQQTVVKKNFDNKLDFRIVFDEEKVKKRRQVYRKRAVRRQEKIYTAIRIISYLNKIQVKSFVTFICILSSMLLLKAYSSLLLHWKYC